jgi:hypothetical protein
MRSGGAWSCRDRTSVGPQRGTAGKSRGYRVRRWAGSLVGMEFAMQPRSHPPLGSSCRRATCLGRAARDSSAAEALLGVAHPLVDVLRRSQTTVEQTRSPPSNWIAAVARPLPAIAATRWLGATGPSSVAESAPEARRRRWSGRACRWRRAARRSPEQVRDHRDPVEFAGGMRRRPVPDTVPGLRAGRRREPLGMASDPTVALRAGRQQRPSDASDAARRKFAPARRARAGADS